MKADDLSSVTQSLCDYSPSLRRDDDDGETMGESTATAPPLYGRDCEKRELLEAYHRVLQTQESQIVFVHGTSGQGKTSLVDTLREPVCESNGYFCTGKFFQDSEIQEPYSAITSAFADLCDLVVQSPDFDEQSRIRIQEGLMANNGHLLSRSVNLNPFFSVESMDLYAGKVSDEKAATFFRFRAACKAFLLVMASSKHPVVLFIDDVQWMDDGSVKLLETFVKDDDFQNVMFVFSYRDEDASSVECILHLSRKKGAVTDIQLIDLDATGVCQILAAKLGSTTTHLDELSDLTVRRTGGNPFFIFLFLETLEAEGLLTMNGPCPPFNVDEIRYSIMVADSIADCLSQKASRLPSELRAVLTVAALVGYRFDQTVLLEVPATFKITTDEEKSERVNSLLTRAVEEGFIERVRGESYQFTHDKVQSAFQGLLDKPTKERFHLLLGKIYLDQGTDGSIYNAVVHLNVAPGFLYCPEQVIVLARFNLEAAQHCQQISAFDMAVALLRKGIKLLGSIEMKWSHETFGLSLELTESLAKMALLVGDFDTCNEATREVILHTYQKEQKVNALFIDVECRMANHDMAGATKASIEALSELGVKLPRKTTMRHVIFKFFKLKFLMASKTDEDILGLPFVKDVCWKATVRLLANLTFYAISMNDPVTGVYAALLAMELTLQHGLSAYAGHALSNFAAVVLRMGNVEYAYNLGKLSLKLMEMSPSRQGDCATIGNVNCGLLHLKEPLCDLRDPLFAAASAGFENGDVIYSTFCISQVFGMDLCTGVHLEVLQRSLRSHYSRIHHLGQDELLTWIRPSMQFLTNLRSSSTDWCQLSTMSGDSMNFRGMLLEANYIMVTATALIMKARMRNALGFYDQARETFKELEPLDQLLQGYFAFNVMCWEAVDAYYEGFIADGKRSHLRKARRYKKHLEQSDALGPNASAFLRHLQFKETLMQRQRRRTSCADLALSETLRIVDRQLGDFSLSDYTTPCFVVARAFVDAGAIAERMSRFGEAEHYFGRAGEIYYENWGAVAPAAWLEEKCDALRREQGTTCNTQNLLVGGIVQFGEEEYT